MLDQTYSQEFEVEQIVDQKLIDGETHYLVKWFGYGHEQNTWEPLRHMTNSKDKIRQWEKFKEKQLSLLQNYQIMDKLDLGPSRNKNPTRTESPFIEGISKASTPYRSFKPIILLDSKDKIPEPEDEQKGKTISLFDRPEVKKITKRRKIQRKQKQLQMFEQRIKSRPKVWEKYLQNEEEAIKLANKKIKQVVDEVFGSKRGQTQKQHKQTLSCQENQQKIIEINPSKMSFEPSPKMRIAEKQEKNGLEKIYKKKKGKALEIFSDSDEETSHLQKSLKKRSQFKKSTFLKDDKDDSSESINESTNFISHIKFPKSQPKNYQEQQICQKKDEISKKPKENELQSMDRQPSTPNSTNQPKVENFVFKEDKPKGIEPNTLRALRTNNSRMPNFIQPNTIKLTDDMLKRLEQRTNEKTQTEESSSSNEVDQGCDHKNLSKDSSSSSSSSSFYHKGQNGRKLSVVPKTTPWTEKHEDKDPSLNNRHNHNDFQSCQLLAGNKEGTTNQKFGIEIIQEKSSSKKELKELQINFDQFINVSDSFEVLQIKVQESRKSEKGSSENSSNHSSSKNFEQNVKLEWSSRVKLSQDNISGLKIQTETKAPEENKIDSKNFLTRSNKFIPFECSVSTIEDVENSDQRFGRSQNFEPEKVQSNLTKTANLLNQQSSEKHSKKSYDFSQINGQRIINYSSMTNHRSTAVHSQVSGQGFHVFTDQNGFNLNLLRNHSLSTRASFNSHKTQVQSQIRNDERNNSEQRASENDVLNQGIYQSTPEHIFSSSSEILDRVNITNEQKRLKIDQLSNSLTLEHILELMNDKSRKLQNKRSFKEESARLVNQLLTPKNNIIDLIQLENDEPSIQISSNTAQMHGSERSSPILLNFMDIGLSNKTKSLNQLPKETHLTKSKATIEQKPITIKKDHDISDFHRMFILENTLTEELK